MAKMKVINETTCWKDFVKLVKTIKPLARGFVKTDRNELFLNMEEGMFQESFVVIKNSDLLPYYNWLCTDLDTMLGQLSIHDIKVKGTSIIDTDTEVVVLKDMERKFSLTKLPVIPNKTHREQANSLYKKIPEFYEKFFDPETKWIPAEPSVMESIIDKKPIRTMIRFMDPKEYVGEIEAIISNDAFPIGNKANSIEFCLLHADREFLKYYVGIREDHDDFMIYSVIAIMMLDEND